jgi:hypothetical protein
LIWGEIKNRVAQECMALNLKEMQTFCKKKKNWSIHKRKIAKVLLPYEEVKRGIMAVRWSNGGSSQQHD